MAKPSIAVILGGKGPPKPPESSPEMEEEEHGDVDEQAHAACAEFAEALGIKHCDAEKLWEAFTALHRLEHQKMDEEDEGEGEEEEPEEEK